MAKHELVHIDKLVTCQADFGEELYSWVQDEELGGNQVVSTQTEHSMTYHDSSRPDGHHSGDRVCRHRSIHIDYRTLAQSKIMSTA